jgi:geranylgeranyl pyrophosphate synthase
MTKDEIIKSLDLNKKGHLGKRCRFIKVFINLILKGVSLDIQRIFIKNANKIAKIQPEKKHGKFSNYLEFLKYYRLEIEEVVDETIDLVVCHEDITKSEFILINLISECLDALATIEKNKAIKSP